VFVQEEITKKYVAFSEDALSEQIAKLTEIVNQQANAIQNLSTSIAQLSAVRSFFKQKFKTP
jgi:hypothetical protein